MHDIHKKEELKKKKQAFPSLGFRRREEEKENSHNVNDFCERITGLLSLVWGQNLNLWT